MFDGIDSTLDLVATQNFSSFISTINSEIQTSPRGSFNTLPTTELSTGFIAAIANQSRVSLKIHRSQMPPNILGTRN